MKWVVCVYRYNGNMAWIIYCSSRDWFLAEQQRTLGKRGGTFPILISSFVQQQTKHMCCSQCNGAEQQQDEKPWQITVVNNRSRFLGG
jgi:hypothetical protein